MACEMEVSSVTGAGEAAENRWEISHPTLVLGREGFFDEIAVEDPYPSLSWKPGVMDKLESSGEQKTQVGTQ
jgi:hypothetical protein